MNDPVRVLVVEDNPEFLERYCAIISLAPDMRLVHGAATMAEARECLAKATPDVILIDLGLPDGDGIDLIREVYARDRDVDIMVVTVFWDEKHIVGALEAGATGYVLKDMTGPELLDAVRELRAGGSPISPTVARQLLRRYVKAGTTPSGEMNMLSPKEKEVLNYISKGFSFAEIAEFLSISPHTIKTHVKHIYKKLAVCSRGEAVFEAKQLGLI